MKTYTTLPGARRAAAYRSCGVLRYKPILRLLNGSATDHVFIVLEDMRTELHAIDPETGLTDGKITFFALSAHG